MYRLYRTVSAYLNKCDEQIKNTFVGTFVVDIEFLWLGCKNGINYDL